MTGSWWLEPATAGSFPGLAAARTWLAEQRLAADSRLAIVLPNSPSLAALLIAAPVSGIDCLLLNHRWPVDQQRGLLEDYGAQAVIGPLDHPRRLDVPAFAPEPTGGDLAGLMDAVGSMSFCTSGSAGTPKRVDLDWEALRHAIRTTADALRLHSADRWFAPLALDHIGGAMCLWRSWLTGHALGLLERWDSATAAAMTRQASGASLVPTMLERLLQQEDCLDGCQQLLIGGAALSASLRARAGHLPLRCTWGMTETASQVCVQDLGARENDCGRPLPGWQLRFDPVSKEISVRGPALMRGYDSTALATDWFATGDCGFLDAAGCLHIDGRLDDRFVCGGENLSTTAIATALCQHPAIDEAVVLPWPDPEWGAVPAALLIGSEEIEVTGWLDDQLPGLWRPRRWCWARSIPMDGRGKKDHERIRQLLAVAPMRPPAS